MEKEQKVLNLHQRLRNVMLDVKAINKENKKVNNQYTFVSHDSVAKALHDPLANHGIVILPSVTELEQDGNRTRAKVDISFVNIDDPKDLITLTYWGYGIDSQDKGIGKAISYAVKYCLLKTFCLETGDDVEKDNIDHKPKSLEIISETQRTELERFLEGNVHLRTNMLKVLKDKYQKTHLSEMPIDLYESALSTAKAAYEKNYLKNLEVSA